VIDLSCVGVDHCDRRVGTADINRSLYQQFQSYNNRRQYKNIIDCTRGAKRSTEQWRALHFDVSAKHRHLTGVLVNR
jgi:hypothetical protein